MERELTARATAPGRYEARLTPYAVGAHRVRVTLGDEQKESASVEARFAAPRPIAPGAVSQPVAVATTRRAAPPAQTRRLRFDVSLAAGLLHNTARFSSALVSLGLGLSYSFGGAGALGLRFSAGFAQATQSVAAPGGLRDVEARLSLLPLSLGLFYRGPERWWVVPYATVSFAMPLVRSSREAAWAEEVATLRVAPGVLAEAGLEVPLGPLAIFVQGGLLYARVDEAELQLLAGGVLGQLGVRLRL